MGVFRRGARRFGQRIQSSLEERRKRGAEERAIFREEFRKAKLRGLRKRAMKEGYAAGSRSQGGLLSPFTGIGSSSRKSFGTFDALKFDPLSPSFGTREKRSMKRRRKMQKAQRKRQTGKSKQIVIRF